MDISVQTPAQSDARRNTILWLIGCGGCFLLTFDPSIGYFCRMTTHEKDKLTILQGTLDLLILRILILGPQHGQGIARAIQSQSDDVLLVDHGSLYPALQRLESRGWIEAEWGASDNNRKARFYKLTRQGRKHLAHQTSQWRRMTKAIGGILGPEPAEG